jgi:hypothetical protein
MNSVENLKPSQWIKLFKAFKSSRIQSLNIFGVWKGFLFEFPSLSGVWKFEKLFSGAIPHVNGPFPFNRLGRSPGPVLRPDSQWPCSPHGERSVPVAAGRRRPRGLATP